VLRALWAWISGFQRRRNEKYMQQIANMSDGERAELERLRWQQSPCRRMGPARGGRYR